MTYRHSDYLDILQPEIMKMRQTHAVATFRYKDLQFDSLAFSGMSGALFAPMLARSLGKELIMVRKRADQSRHNPGVNHSPFAVEGFSGCKLYVIVDDTVSMGGTVRHIVTEIKSFAPDAQCVGIFCYWDWTWKQLLPSDFRFRELFQPGGALYSEANNPPAISLADDPTVLSEPDILGDEWRKSWEAFRDTFVTSEVNSKSEEPPVITELSDEPGGESF